MKGDSKFDVGSVIGITLGFIVLFIGFYDVTPVSKITADMPFEMYQNKVLLNPTFDVVDLTKIKNIEKNTRNLVRWFLV